MIVQTTFVCCIEAGPLEGMAIRLVRSLRQHGGDFKNSPVVVCQPRFGPKISQDTLKFLEALEAEYVQLSAPRPFDWYHYLNKGVALASLNDSIQTDWVTFLDSDMLIAQAPGDLVGDDVDFIACAPDTGLVGSTGPGHRYDASWLSYIELLGLAAASVPMIREHEGGERIRFYFNSGLFSYRRSSGFAFAYREAMLQCLQARLGFPDQYEHYTDQVVLGLCALKLGLRWRELPSSYNLTVDRDHNSLPDAVLREGRVLHYHKALSQNPGVLFDRLRATHPDLAAWLELLGPIADRRSRAARTYSEILRMTRAAPRRVYRKQVDLRTPL